MNILQTIENVLKKGLLTIFIATILEKLFAFIGNTVIVRLVSKAEYGIYAYANNQLRFFLLLTGFGAVSAIMQMCSESLDDPLHSEKIYSYGRKIGLRFNVILAGLILVYALCVTMPITGANALLVLMCCLPLVEILPGFQKTFLRTQLKNNQYAVSNVVSAICHCLFLVGGTILCKTKGLIAGRYLAALVSTVLIYKLYHVHSLRQLNEDLSKNVRRDFNKIAVISMANNAISQLLYLVDVLVIGFFIPNEEVIAMYNVATKIPTAMAVIPAAIITFVYPYFARHRNDKKWVKRNYLHCMGATLLADTAVAVPLYIIAPHLLSALYGSSYLDAVLPFRILLIGFIFAGTFRVLAGNILVSQRELKFNFIVAVISGITNIIADIVLIMFYGSTGAAIATVLIQIISGVMSTARMLYILR